MKTACASLACYKSMLGGLGAVRDGCRSPTSLVVTMYRTRLACIGASPSGSRWSSCSAALVAVLAAGCSSSGTSQGDSPIVGVGAGGVVGFAGAPAIPMGAGGSSAPPTPSFTGTCPSALFKECKNCHDGRGTAGTPMGLLTWEDFHAPAPKNPSMQVYQILSQRLHSTMPTPMPPEGQLEPAKLSAIDAWIQAGAPDCGGFTRAMAPPGGSGGAMSGGGGSTPIGP